MKGTKWMILLCATLLSCGMAVSAAPFDPAYYAAQNPDVVQAVGEDETALELHYNTFGAAEGRAGNAQDAAAREAKAPVSFEEFDPVYYAEQNPDVTALLGTDPAVLYAHYVQFGVAENRAGNAQDAAARKAKAPVSFEEFDPVYYAEQNPDVTALLGTDPVALYAHYVRSGAAEGRASRAAAASKEDTATVENSYARSASSDSGSESDADDDDDSGSSESGSSESGSSAQTHRIYTESEITYKASSESESEQHYVVGCNVENCNEHWVLENCDSSFEADGENGHIIKCSKCDRADHVSHDNNWQTDIIDGVAKHWRICLTCGFEGEKENCTMQRKVVFRTCIMQCSVCGRKEYYEHTDDDWRDDGKCSKPGCYVYKENSQ